MHESVKNAAIIAAIAVIVAVTGMWIWKGFSVPAAAPDTGPVVVEIQDPAPPMSSAGMQPPPGTGLPVVR